MKPDLMRAQKMLRRSLVNMIDKCNLNGHWDLFIVISLVCTSAVFTEVISSAKLTSSDDVEKLVKFATNQFADLLREDLTERMLKEQAERRH